jgi:hypothetical protein
MLLLDKTQNQSLHTTFYTPMHHIFGENERFWYRAMRIGAPFWHWMERSKNGRFWCG